jgi:LacI family transcriptional regulator
MKSLSAIARELGVSVATVSYVYNDKWRENRIHPDLAERVRRKLSEQRVLPDARGRQLRSGRTMTIGVLLPHLDQPYFLKLLAGIEQWLYQSDYMVLLGSAHWQHEGRQVGLLQRMLARRVDALLMAPRPAADLAEFVTSLIERPGAPLVFIDNYLPGVAVPRVLSDNRWGAREAVRRIVSAGRRRILFFGGDESIAAIHDRYLGYCDALQEAGLPLSESLTIWWWGREEAALESLRSLLASADRPDAIFGTSFLRFFPVLKVLDELTLTHPADVLLAGFDEPLESWTQDTVHRVVREPLLTVIQAAAEIGQQAVELALAAIDGQDVCGQQRLIRPVVSWQPGDESETQSYELNQGTK